MRTKFIIFATILASLLVIVLNKGNNSVNNSLISILNPIKIWYKNMLTKANNDLENYIFQASSIEKLRSKNIELEKSILMQKNYINQTAQIKDIIPSLSKVQVNDKVELVQTISYVKINNFTEILLTKPSLAKEGLPYGLIKDGVVSGVGKLIDNNFHGYLTSNDKCKLTVFVGDKKAPGVAVGDGKNGMTVQFIPRWFDIKAGDKVVTSGLDGIFYANIPVGIVQKVEIQSSYKVAYIKTYNDLYNPKLFFVLSGEKNMVFAQSSSIKNNINTTSSILDTNASTVTPSTLSSTPLIEIDQTRVDVVIPEQTTAQYTYRPKPKPKLSQVKKQVKPKPKPKPKPITNNSRPVEIIEPPASTNEDMSMDSNQPQPLP